MVFLQKVIGFDGFLFLQKVMGLGFWDAFGSFCTFLPPKVTLLCFFGVFLNYFCVLLAKAIGKNW